jgi:hypothetical protein
LSDKNNLSVCDNNDITVLYIKEVKKTFKAGKWWFTGTFIVILIISLFFSFYINRDSRYGINSQLRISSNSGVNQTKLSALYPQESFNLWLNLTEQDITYYLSVIISQIRTEATIVDKLNKSLNLDLSNNKLQELIALDYDIEESNITITTYHSDLETAKRNL